MNRFIQRHFFPTLAALAGALFALLMVVKEAPAAPPGSLWIPNSIPSGQSTLTPPRPLYTDVLVLVANTSQTQAIPAGSQFVVFSGACNFFAAAGGTATVPAASTTTGLAPQQNPAAWFLNAGDTQITLVAASGCIVTLSFYTK